MQTVHQSYKQRAWRETSWEAQSAGLEERTRLFEIRAEEHIRPYISWYTLLKVWHARCDTSLNWSLGTWNRNMPLHWKQIYSSSFWRNFRYWLHRKLPVAYSLNIWHNHIEGNEPVDESKMQRIHYTQNNWNHLYTFKPRNIAVNQYNTISIKKIMMIKVGQKELELSKETVMFSLSLDWTSCWTNVWVAGV